MSDRTPELGSIINNAFRLRQGEIHVSIPGRVESADLTKGMVDVKPLVHDVLELDDGTVTSESVPVLRNVPICWPGAGGVRITFPVKAGDTGLLVFCERSIDAWKSYGGEVDPVDLRRHDLSDAVFFPGTRSFSNPWTGADAAALTIGTDGGPFQGIGLGEAIKSMFDSLKLYIDTHPHPTAVGPTSVPTTPSPSVPALASTTVKVSS